MPRTKTQRKALAALNYDLFSRENIAPPAPVAINTRIDAHTASPPPVEVKSPAIDAAELPSETELYRMFDMYNWLYFGGKLPGVEIQYSTRMSTAGSYSIEKRLIKIGRKYHEIFPEEVSDTLKHEMIHIRHFKHDSAFKREALRIGASVKAQSHPLLQKSPRYIYACPGCGKEYPRQKRLRMSSCGDCSARGRFDRRYKLVLVRSQNRK